MSANASLRSTWLATRREAAPTGRDCSPSFALSQDVAQDVSNHKRHAVASKLTSKMLAVVHRIPECSNWMLASKSRGFLFFPIMWQHICYNTLLCYDSKKEML